MWLSGDSQGRGKTSHTPSVQGGGTAERGWLMPAGYHGNGSQWERQPEDAESGFSLPFLF